MSQCDLTGASVWHMVSQHWTILCVLISPDNKKLTRTNQKWTRYFKLSCFIHCTSKVFLKRKSWCQTRCQHFYTPKPTVTGHTTSQSVGTLLCPLKGCKYFQDCLHVVVGVCVPFTCPVSCWHIRGWLVAGVRCRRAEPLGGRVLLFAVALHLEGACRLQTHPQAGSRRHVLQGREMNQKMVKDEWERGILWLLSSSHWGI